jgi:outer membrane immunogenic protein
MKRSLFASVSVLALTLTTATAADLPARSARMPVKAPELASVWSWTGFYLGINGGGVWHRAEADVVSGVGDTAATTVKSSGATFGGQIGANWQVQQFVLGIEADWNWVDASGTANFVGFGPATFSSKLSSLATVRGRLGVAFSSTMVYATGGFAAGKVNNQVPTLFGGYAIDDDVKFGWTVGGGIEHMFSRNWSAKVEALYVDLGRSTVSGNIDPAYVGRFDNTAIVGRAGLKFKW